LLFTINQQHDEAAFAKTEVSDIAIIIVILINKVDWHLKSQIFR